MVPVSFYSTLIYLALSPIDPRLWPFLPVREVQTVRSLHITGTRTEKSKQTGFTDVYTFDLWLERMPSDRWQGVLHFVKSNQRDDFQTFVLADGQLYECRSRDKSIRLWGPISLEALANYWQPVVAFIDPGLAAKKYQARLVKQDQWYTYFELSQRPYVAKKETDAGWWPGFYVLNNNCKSRIILHNNHSEQYAAKSVRQIWYEQTNSDELLYDIQSWKYDVARPAHIQVSIPKVPAGWHYTDYPPSSEQLTIAPRPEK